MASLSEFSRRIVVRAQRVADNVDQLVRKTALAVDREVVTSTPVDTGRARSNWIASLGSPARREVDSYASGLIGPDADATTSGAIAQQSAEGAMAQAAGVIAGRKQGQDIYISNNLPYIGRLNDGYSAQAPSGFVEKAVQAGSRTVQRTKVVD